MSNSCFEVLAGDLPTRSRRNCLLTRQLDFVSSEKPRAERRIAGSAEPQLIPIVTRTFMMRDHSAVCATTPRMCLISSRTHSHQRVTNLASHAMIIELSKRVQRDKNNQLPMSSRTPGSPCCSGSNLESGGVTECPASGANTNQTKTEFHSVLQDLRCVIALSESKTTTRGGTQTLG